MPGCARSTRAMCSACAPTIMAVASSQCSAIQRRRVMAIRNRFLSSLQVYASRTNTEGDALCAPLGCCLLLVYRNYFFFAAFLAGAFLAAFFAGAFLAA